MNTLTSSITRPQSATPFELTTEEHDNTGVIVGSVIGSVAGAALLGVGIYFLYVRVLKKYFSKAKVLPETPANKQSETSV